MVGTFAAAILTVLVSIFTVDVESFDRYRWVLVVALAAFIIVLHPRLLGGLIAMTARVIRRRPFQVTMGYLETLRILGLYVLNWLVFGVALYLLIRSFYPVQPSLIVYLAGAFSFAGMVGILAVFAPSGLGVRDGLLALFLCQVMPTGVALLAAIVTRVWLTVAELASVGVVFSLMRLGVIDVGGTESLRAIRNAAETLDGGVESES